MSQEDPLAAQAQRARTVAAALLVSGLLFVVSAISAFSEWIAASPSSGALWPWLAALLLSGLLFGVCSHLSRLVSTAPDIIPVQPPPPPRPVWRQGPQLDVETLRSCSWELLHHLTAVNGYSDLVLDMVRFREENREDIEEIRRAGERAVLVAIHLQWASQARTAKAQATEVCSFLRDLHPRLTYAAERGVQVRMDLDPETGIMIFDRDLLEWLLLSLTTTALSPIVSIGCSPGLIVVNGGGHPEMAAIVTAWKTFGGQVEVDNGVVSVRAPQIVTA